MSEDDKVAIAMLSERVNNWIGSTESYRASLCEKMAELKGGQIKIFEMMYDLPCRERAEMTKSINLSQKLMWSAIGITFGILIKHLFGI